MLINAPGIAANLPPPLSPTDYRRVFIHDPSVMNDPGYNDICLSAQYSLAERALWLADPDDMLMLAYPLEPAYLDYVWSLGAGSKHIVCVPPSAGGGLTETLLAQPHWAHVLASWAQHSGGAIFVDTYCTTSKTNELIDTLSHSVEGILPPSANAAATLLANQKSCVRAVLDELDIPKIPGGVINTADIPLQEAARRVREFISVVSNDHHQVMVRVDYSSGGKGNTLIDSVDTTSLEGWLEQHCEAQSLLVEAYLPWKSSPNVQYWIDAHGRPELFLITNQRVRNTTSHFGNLFPTALHANAELREQSAKIASWLADIGVRGFVGIDFIDTHKNGIRFVEVNARVNGSSYASAIALRMNHLRVARARHSLTAWCARSQVRCTTSSFADLLEHTADLLYDHDKPCGVVPYWTGAMEYGYFSCVTLAEDPGQLQGTEAEFLNRILGT